MEEEGRGRAFAVVALCFLGISFMLLLVKRGRAALPWAKIFRSRDDMTSTSMRDRVGEG